MRLGIPLIAFSLCVLAGYAEVRSQSKSGPNGCALVDKSGNIRKPIPMKLTWHGHSEFRIEAGAAEILIDPFLPDNPSWDKGWSGYLAGKNSTQGGNR
jgi:hypothetical protein